MERCLGGHSKRAPNALPPRLQRQCSDSGGEGRRNYSKLATKSQGSSKQQQRKMTPKTSSKQVNRNNEMNGETSANTSFDLIDFSVDLATTPIPGASSTRVLDELGKVFDTEYVPVDVSDEETSLPQMPNLVTRGGSQSPDEVSTSQEFWQSNLRARAQANEIPWMDYVIALDHETVLRQDLRGLAESQTNGHVKPNHQVNGNFPIAGPVPGPSNRPEVPMRPPCALNPVLPVGYRSRPPVPPAPICPPESPMLMDTSFVNNRRLRMPQTPPKPTAPPPRIQDSGRNFVPPPPPATVNRVTAALTNHQPTDYDSPPVDDAFLPDIISSQSDLEEFPALSQQPLAVNGSTVSTSAVASGGRGKPKYRWEAGGAGYGSSFRGWDSMMANRSKNDDDFKPSPYRNHNFDDRRDDRFSSFGGRSEESFGVDEEKELYTLFRSPNDGFKFVDTHCHLDFLFNNMRYGGSWARFKTDYAATFPPTYEACIADFCDPTTYGDSADGYSVWEKVLDEKTHPDVYGAFGVHPHQADKWSSSVRELVEARCMHPRVVAIGEMGLDYSHRNKVDRELQKSVFRDELSLAFANHKPIVIHCRDAEDDCFTILKEECQKHNAMDSKIHRHCFTNDLAEAQRWMRQFPNLFIGLTPIVHQPPEKMKELIEYIDDNRVVIETDAPYFLPRLFKQEMYGRLSHSHPGMGFVVAAALAKAKKKPVTEVLQKIRNNTKRLYDI